MLIWPRVVCATLLVSPFTMEWEYYVWAGGVEVSEFCLFLVVFPAKFFSSVFPRLYFRKHAFCFLPLAAILESSELFLKAKKPSVPIFFLSFNFFYYGRNLCAFLKAWRRGREKQQINQANSSKILLKYDQFKIYCIFSYPLFHPKVYIRMAL
jgi:hypothetical protein